MFRPIGLGATREHKPTTFWSRVLGPSDAMAKQWAAEQRYDAAHGEVVDSAPYHAKTSIMACIDASLIAPFLATYPGDLKEMLQNPRRLIANARFSSTDGAGKRGLVESCLFRAPNDYQNLVVEMSDCEQKKQQQQQDEKDALPPRWVARISPDRERFAHKAITKGRRISLELKSTPGAVLLMDIGDLQTLGERELEFGMAPTTPFGRWIVAGANANSPLPPCTAMKFHAGILFIGVTAGKMYDLVCRSKRKENSVFQTICLEPRRTDVGGSGSV